MTAHVDPEQRGATGVAPPIDFAEFAEAFCDGYIARRDGLDDDDGEATRFAREIASAALEAAFKFEERSS